VTGQNLARALPSRFVLAVTVGGVIGLGILRGPGQIAEVVTDSSLYLALWLLAGLFVLLSTAVCAELVGMTPRSGGFYSLIRRAYGPYAGFVIGWADWLTYAADLALSVSCISSMEHDTRYYCDDCLRRYPAARNRTGCTDPGGRDLVDRAGHLRSCAAAVLCGHTGERHGELNACR